MSNVSELRKNLVDKVLGLGVGGEFLGHPAIGPALARIDSLIGQMNLSDPESVYVSEDDGKISFGCTVCGTKYNFELTASEDSVSCIRVEEPQSFVGNTGDVVRQKNAVEVVSKLDGEQLIITSNYGSMDNIGCDNKHYNLASSIEKCVYDKDGIMNEREGRYYQPRKGAGFFHRVGADELLSFARWVPHYSTWNDVFTTRTLLRRDTLDVANVVYQDRSTGQEHYGKVPLHQEHGLRDMYIANGYGVYPMPEVRIYPLMESEVEEMLAREKDERVANGLRKYAVGRTTYSYNSNGDGQNTNSPKVM